jgi:hypothetical protein
MLAVNEKRWFINRTTSCIVQVTVRRKHEITVGRFVTIDKLSTGVPRAVLRCIRNL